ncbi:hypothetical protein C0J52_04344 [Blattella germanica]|nr:hypothetical protein C0J52_04344 [Blattella germanica]
MNSITQRACQREFYVPNPSKRNTVLELVNKLKRTGYLVREISKRCSSRLPMVVIDVRTLLEQSPKKSLRCLLQKYTYSMCQRTVKSADLKPI